MQAIFPPALGTLLASKSAFISFSENKIPNLEDAKSNASFGNVTIPVRRAVALVIYIRFSGPISGIVQHALG